MQPVPGLDPQPQPKPRRRAFAGVNGNDRGGWRVIVGLCIVGWGLLATASNFDNDVAYRILQRWYFPCAMIVIGLYRSWRACTGLGRMVGGFLAAIGIWWVIADTLGIHFDLRDWWPLVIVGFGVLMIYRAVVQEPAASSSAASPDFSGTTASYSAPFGSPGSTATSTEPGAAAPIPGAPVIDAGPISAFAFWSGVHKRVSAGFRRANLAAVMGGIELDLRPAVTVGGQATLEVFVLMGGLEITVPPDWTVTNEALVIMGGIEDRSSGSPAATQKLVIRGLILMGGVEIKT